MKCLKCNNDMKEGSIQCGDEIAWFPKGEKKIALRKSINANKVVIGTFSHFLGGNAVAYYCENCKLITISTEQ